MSRLTIISLPLYRIARVSLAAEVLRPLRRLGDVAIVAPFAAHPGFQEAFGGPRTIFVPWRPPAHSALSRSLLAVSEVMRRDGYYRRHRARGMEHYVRNQLTTHEVDGNDVAMPPKRYAAVWMLSRLGVIPGAWRVVDRAMGTEWCRLPQLEELADCYEHVTLVQSANWGDQDRAISRLSATKAWRRVLLPYTVDQLDVNGDLLNDFDAICAQGPFEAERAITHHGVSDDRIVRLGSVWLRHLGRLRDEVAVSTSPMVLYAGVSSLYFPRSSEIDAVASVAELLRCNFPEYRLVYRPVAADDSEKQHLETRFASAANMSLQWPASAEIGLEEFADPDPAESLRRYVRNLAGCRLMIMSNITSLAIDVSFLARCGVISNRIDPTGMLARRHAEVMTRPWFDSMRIVRRADELLRETAHLLANPAQGAAEAQSLLSHWDYPGSDFDGLLARAITGRAGAVAA